jgi:SAM-dependent methyltransferase
MSKYNYHDLLAFIGVGGAHPGGLTLTKSLLEKEKLGPRCKVLDAGCGTGQTAAYIAKTYGCHVTAIDQHPVMIQKAKQRFQRDNIKADAIQGNIEQMPFKDATFDLILAESVTVFTDISKTMKEYARVLKQGGTLLDLEMAAIPPLPDEMTSAFQQLYGISHIPAEKEWRHACEQACLSDIEILLRHHVMQPLYEPEKQPENEAAPDFTFSDKIDPSLYHIWDAHQLLTEKYAGKLNYILFKARK